MGLDGSTGLCAASIPLGRDEHPGQDGGQREQPDPFRPDSQEQHEHHPVRGAPERPPHVGDCSTDRDGPAMSEPLDPAVAAALHRIDASLHAIENKGKRNGHSLPRYIWNNATLANICWTVGIIFMAGSWVRQAQTDMTSAAAAAKEATRVAAEISVKFDAIQATVLSQQTIITTLQEKSATKADLGAVSDRVRLAVTRKEFQDFQRTALPALQRIERKVEDAR
jgi:hypothetical protein